MKVFIRPCYVKLFEPLHHSSAVLCSTTGYIAQAFSLCSPATDMAFGYDDVHGQRRSLFSLWVNTCLFETKLLTTLLFKEVQTLNLKVP